MSVVYTVVLVMLSVAGALTVVRLVRGPNVLDRIVALDVIVTLLVAGIAVGVATSGQGSAVPVLIVLALLGFVGSVTAAHLVEEREGMR
ncbi:monovalent cation/H+ antiporter complex subunit F [Streptomyces sp. TRM 70351]|uniref:monovalent cation/H+ antiporter complex subunit F n=1 Tax=Streptomyces sp. TRM 70351 TaxID=3116552 RepID=UPI002E7C33F8|nr:monovalent cation/H+ antiporter complex subunit F [Streptomyces sp. TRM 70351]MEE1929545.1 monovalent cation/H+ antiporter complex subunit F [Streptomyces sp. TRM 70351]